MKFFVVQALQLSESLVIHIVGFMRSKAHSLRLYQPPKVADKVGATVNRHSPAHHPLDVHYSSIADEPQLS
jgi:hypothetical protein